MTRPLARPFFRVGASALLLGSLALAVACRKRPAAPPASAKQGSQALPPSRRVNVAQPSFRNLHFPSERAVGRLFITDWEELVDDTGSLDYEARGEIPVSANLEVYLWIDESAIGDLSFLGSLNPEDIQGIIFPRAREDGNPKVEAAQLVHLERLTALRSLDFTGCALEGSALTRLRPLKRLEKLYLGMTRVGDQDLLQIKDLHELQHLDLQGTTVTAAGIDTLKGLINLEYLNLARTGITDDSVAKLDDLKYLNCLFVSHTGLTDGAVGALKSLAALQSLYIFDSRLTERGLEQLRGGMPGCKIFPLVPVVPTPKLPPSAALQPLS